MEFDAQNLKPVHDFIAAETIRDLYKAAFPVIVAPLKQTERFARYVRDGTNTGGTIRAPATNREAIIKEFNPAFREMAHLICAYQEKAFRTCPSTVPTWISDFAGLLDNKNGEMFHHESPDKKLVYLAANKNGTLIVDHADVLTILEKSPLKHFLDVPLKHTSAVREAMKKLMAISTGDMTQEDVENWQNITRQFNEAAKPIMENTIYGITHLTPHRRPSVVEYGRVLGTCDTSFNLAA